jgi:biotin carboxyl carrier protein
MARYSLTHLGADAVLEHTTRVCDVRDHAQGSGRRCVEVEIAGVRRSAEVLSTGNPYLVLIDNQPIEVLEHDGRYTVLRGGPSFIEARTRDTLRASTSLATGTLVAPMPGKIVRVLCQLGNTVDVGTPLVVLEAMKMENELRAARAGRVTAIFVTEGSAVESRAKLVELS